MNTPIFSGPFQWGKVRRQLLALRDDVQSIRKVAGRNVTVSEYEGKGSVINVTRERGQAAPPAATGACCIDDECSIVTETACGDAGGNYLGDNSTCEGVDCTQGACCDDNGDCTLTTLEECTGQFQGYGTTCDPNPCPPAQTGACCMGSDCSVETEDDCIGMGGTYYGDGSDCDPNPCPPPCCGTTYPGFLTGNPYFTKATHVVIVGDTEPSPPFVEECHWRQDRTTILDSSTCSNVTTCYGTCLYDGPAGHDEGSWVSDGGDGCLFDPSCSTCELGCSTFTTVSMTDTEWVQTCHDTLGTQTIDVTITTTLSNPCIEA